MKYTWNMLYGRADGAGCGDPWLKAKDTARYNICGLMVNLNYPNPEISECPEDEIDEFCRTHDVLFNEYGDIICYKPIRF